MKLGRREFLKFVTAAVAGTSVRSAAEVYQSPKFYADKKLGFGFEIPAGWHLEAFREDFNELLGGQKLSSSDADEEEVFRASAEGILATLSKYPLVGDSPNRFSPSMTFFKADDSCLEEGESLLDFTSQALSGFELLLTDYECIEEPRLVKRSDCVMVRSKSKFLFEHEDMKSVLIDDEMFMVHHQGAIYTIHLYDSPYTDDPSQSEFRIFRNSLHIA